MQTKHTPAPWFINGPFIGDSDLFIRTNIDGEGFDIATLNVDETGDYEANAKLIAAAPELLEALRELLNLNPHDINISARLNAEDKAQKAIAKATL